MTRNRLYTILGIACTIGYGWLFFSLFLKDHFPEFTVCFFKNITGLPCPSCGATRAAAMIVDGNIVSSFLLNPLGIILVMIMLVVPVWLCYDLILKKNGLYNSFLLNESRIRQKKTAYILTALILINWVWNIHKQL